MNAMSLGSLSRKDRIEAGRNALAGLFPDMIAGRPEPVSAPSGATRRADMRSWDIPDPEPEQVPALEPEPVLEADAPDGPKPEPRRALALDERTLGNLAVNTGEQALGAISDLFPSPRADPETDAEVEDPFGAPAGLTDADPKDAGRRMLEEMQLSFQSLFGMGGKSEPDHKAGLEPELPEAPGDVPDIRETEVFAHGADDPDLPRPCM